jgi:aminoglycoside 6'-N-acetyltransferase I
MSFEIQPVREDDWEQWRRMRLALWPDATGPDDDREMREYLAGSAKAAFVAVAEEGRPIGFLEASIRDYADGCDSRHVGYIEGWYVEEAYRRQGVGAALVQAAEAWARDKGCREMGSDCLQDNELSLAVHLALGYQEKERLIHFGKVL